MSVVSESFLLGKEDCDTSKTSIWTKKKNHSVQTADKVDGSQTRSFQISQDIFRFCWPQTHRQSGLDLHPSFSSSFLHAELHSTSCGNPGVPPKAVLSGSGRFAVGDQVQYSCVPGYVLDGHATLTCITNAGNTAVWDFPAPICRGMRNLMCARVWLYMKCIPLKWKPSNWG